MHFIVLLYLQLFAFGLGYITWALILLACFNFMEKKCSYCGETEKDLFYRTTTHICKNCERDKKRKYRLNSGYKVIPRAKLLNGLKECKNCQEYKSFSEFYNTKAICKSCCNLTRYKSKRVYFKYKKNTVEYKRIFSASYKMFKKTPYTLNQNEAIILGIKRLFNKNYLDSASLFLRLQIDTFNTLKIIYERD